MNKSLCSLIHETKKVIQHPTQSRLIIYLHIMIWQKSSLFSYPSPTGFVFDASLYNDTESIYKGFQTIFFFYGSFPCDKLHSLYTPLYWKQIQLIFTNDGRLLSKFWPDISASEKLVMIRPSHVYHKIKNGIY